MWAGSASPVMRWTRRTPVPVLSVSKGLVAIAAYRAHQRGQLDFDAPVTRYWPEYGTAGKAHTTVRDLFSHRAGLPGSGVPAHPGRLDPGDPARYQRGVARLRSAPPPETAAEAEVVTRIARSPLMIDALTAAGALSLNFADDRRRFNDPAVRAIDIPAAGTIASADGLARIYAATVGPVDGVRLFTDDSLPDILVADRLSIRGRRGAVRRRECGSEPGSFSTAYRTGRCLSPTSFGHDGLGAALGFADVDAEIGLGYVNNQMGSPHDERANRLTAALQSCL